MNQSKLSKRTSVLLFLSILLSFLWSSCTKSIIEEGTAMQDLTSPRIAAIITPGPEVPACKSQDYCLWADQTINAGSVTVSNDAQNLYITVNATENFRNVPENIKVWVGKNLDLLPRAGNKAPLAGDFPFKANATGNTHTITIPFNSIDTYSSDKITCNNSALYVFVQVDISISGNSEAIAWGGCLPGKGSPAWYFYDTYATGCCDATAPSDNCYSQTAFAKGDWIFTTDKKSNPEGFPTLGLTKNRWGWAINIKATGNTTYPIYAGAGLNTISKGKQVGTLSVSWDGTNATVAYSMDGSFTLTATHVYAGDNKPTTIAPGQYGNTMSFDPAATNYTGTYSVSDSNGDGIWIIAHAGAYGCY
ncbi:MAG: hypothetical protein ACTHMM_17070 [Agriterribacter sp.]